MLLVAIWQAYYSEKTSPTAITTLAVLLHSNRFALMFVKPNANTHIRASESVCTVYNSFHLLIGCWPRTRAHLSPQATRQQAMIRFCRPTCAVISGWKTDSWPVAMPSQASGFSLQQMHPFGIRTIGKNFKLFLRCSLHKLITLLVTEMLFKRTNLFYLKIY